MRQRGKFACSVQRDGRRQELLTTRAALRCRRSARTAGPVLESAVLGCAGGALGVAIAAGSSCLFQDLRQATLLPRMEEISIDSRVLRVLAAGISLVAAFSVRVEFPCTASAPRPWKEAAERPPLVEREAKQGIVPLALLVSAQVALSAPFCWWRTGLDDSHCAGHYVKSILGLSEAANVQTARIDLPEPEVKEPERMALMEEKTLRKIDPFPRVSRAALSSFVPMDGDP